MQINTSEAQLITNQHPKWKPWDMAISRGGIQACSHWLGSYTVLSMFTHTLLNRSQLAVHNALRYKPGSAKWACLSMLKWNKTNCESQRTKSPKPDWTITTMNRYLLSFPLRLNLLPGCMYDLKFISATYIWLVALLVIFSIIAFVSLIKLLYQKNAFLPDASINYILGTNWNFLPKSNSSFCGDTLHHERKDKFNHLFSLFHIYSSNLEFFHPVLILIQLWFFQ